MSNKPLVFICSPYRGDIELNTIRARRFCRFAYSQGTAPFAPHLHNTQFLQEDIPEEREAGIALGLEVMKRVDEVWLFGNELTEGIKFELRSAHQMKIPVRYFTDKCEEREVDSNE